MKPAIIGVFSAIFFIGIAFALNVSSISVAKDVQNSPTYAEDVLVFVTSLKFYNPNLLETPTADELCQEAADAAYLPGTFAAWLSTDEYNAADRIPEGRYIRIDGISIADNKADLVDGHLRASLLIDEFSRGISGGFVYTGTKSNGQKWRGRMCNNWQGLDINNAENYYAGLGDLTANDKKWTEFTSQACDQAYYNGAHLYCFQTENANIDIKITAPLDDEIVFLDHTPIEVTTNEDTTCVYRYCRIIVDGTHITREDCIPWDAIDQEVGRQHSGVINNLQHTMFPDFYNLEVQCTLYDEWKEDSVNFFVDRQ